MVDFCVFDSFEIIVWDHSTRLTDFYAFRILNIINFNSSHIGLIIIMWEQSMMKMYNVHVKMWSTDTIFVIYQNEYWILNKSNWTIDPILKIPKFGYGEYTIDSKVLASQYKHAPVYVNQRLENNTQLRYSTRRSWKFTFTEIVVLNC